MHLSIMAMLWTLERADIQRWRESCRKNERESNCGYHYCIFSDYSKDTGKTKESDLKAREKGALLILRQKFTYIYG